MTTLKIYQVDAFTDQVFGGNPAAICPLKNWLPDEVMQNIAMENNLAETAFFVPKGDQFELRWFTPEVEVDLCGHATLATAHILFSDGYEGNEITFFSPRSGELKVRKSKHGYTMNFPTDTLEKIETPSPIIEALGITPQATYRGKTDYMAILDSQEQIEDLAPNFYILGQMDGRGLIVTAPGKNLDFVSRCFYPQCGINEDPTTGSAHTSMTPYWAKRLGKKELTASQLSKRVGKLNCTYLEDRVEISGNAKTFLTGEIHF